ncbi:hypothetical protein [Elongatibacter sediminis]|uniref:Sulfotransferase domain-containing protein n=1 Tax=Elongatibacter sediminis TaxID=3119006 RepID=A0AAW9RB77_9GAMM
MPPEGPAPPLPELAGTAHWHLFDIDADAEKAALIRLDEPDYRQAGFLDQRILPAAPERRMTSLAELDEALSEGPATAADPAFIFHIGHCGSTLLSRAFDASAHTLPLREPLTLRRLPLLDAARRESLLKLVLRAHGRAFHPRQIPVIKATSICNGLIEPVLNHRPASRALLMYVDLDTYLAGMLGKHQPARDLRGHIEARLADWQSLPGAPVLDPGSLDEARLAALAWLTGMRHLATAGAATGGRVRLLHFETFLESPEQHLKSLAAWFGLDDDLPDLLEAWPAVSTGYSKKPDEPYSAFNRRRTLHRGRLERASDIQAGLRWAESMIDQTAGLSVCSPYLRP